MEFTKFLLCSLGQLILPVPLASQFLMPSLVPIQLFVRLEVILTKNNPETKTALKLLWYMNKQDGLGQLCHQSLHIIKLHLRVRSHRTCWAQCCQRKPAPASFTLAECTFHQFWYPSDFSMIQSMAEPGGQLIQWKKVDTFSVRLMGWIRSTKGPLSIWAITRNETGAGSWKRHWERESMIRTFQ